MKNCWQKVVFTKNCTCLNGNKIKKSGVRRLKRKWILWIAMILFCVAAGAGNDTKAQAGTLSTRGVWISAFEYEDLGLVGTMSESQFRANAASVFAKVKANGCNTVYFHVRSFDDAIYPSKVVGWSERFTKGKGAPSYDPLKILIDTAHRYGLKFHAWMNPYRVTFKKVLDPAEDATTDRIVSQVKEIINKYKVDGIHFDDYFYPNNEKKYKKLSKAEKMFAVNKMVRKVHSTVKAKSSRLLFGISPAGNPTYCHQIGADVETWLSI